jgi:hypothetical protein
MAFLKGWLYSIHLTILSTDTSAMFAWYTALMAVVCMCLGLVKLLCELQSICRRTAAELYGMDVSRSLCVSISFAELIKLKCLPYLLLCFAMLAGCVIMFLLLTLHIMILVMLSGKGEVGARFISRFRH